MKRLSILLITTLILSLLAGCSQGDYTLLERGGNYYIRLNRSANGSVANDHLTSSDPVSRIQFSSITEMKNDIQSGNFTQKELDIIATFDRDDAGQIQICNIEKLYEPTFPAIFNSYIVTWYGDSYRFKLTSSNSEAIGNFTFQTKEFFDKNIVYYTIVDTDKLHSMTTNDDGSITYEYTSSFGIYVRLTYRTIDLDSKQLFIVEEVIPEISEDIPDRYLIFGCEHGQYYYLTINEHEEKLTLDQLSQFGIREYVETVTE